MGDAARGGMEVEERVMVYGGRPATYTDTDGARSGKREWRAREGHVNWGLRKREWRNVKKALEELVEQLVEDCTSQQLPVSCVQDVDEEHAQVQKRWSKGHAHDSCYCQSSSNPSRG